MKVDKPNTGDVFLAHNKYMYPPKNKFHLCINEKMYFLINTKESAFNCMITPQDCSFLAYPSYINCGNIRIEPIEEFNIIKKEQLSKEAIRRLIEKVKYVPTLLESYKKTVIAELETCL